MAIFENGKRVKSLKTQKTEERQLFNELKELATLKEQNKWLIVVIKKLLKKCSDKEALELLGEEMIREIFPPKKEVPEPTFRKI